MPSLGSTRPGSPLRRISRLPGARRTLGISDRNKSRTTERSNEKAGELAGIATAAQEKITFPELGHQKKCQKKQRFKKNQEVFCF